MRVIVINSRADVEAIASQLAEDKGGSTLEHIEKLNPHADFKKIEPGTVLLVPDPPRKIKDAARSIQGGAFDSLREQITSGLRASGARVRQGYETLNVEAKELTAVLKSAAVKRALEADPELKPQIDAAANVFKQDAADAKAAEQTLNELEAATRTELDKLGKLLG